MTKDQDTLSGTSPDLAGNAQSTPLALLTHLRVEAGKLESFLALIGEYAKDVRNFESGQCLAYHVVCKSGDPHAVLIFARYASEEAYHAHLNAPHTVTVMDVLKPMIDGNPEIEIYLG